MPTGSNPAFSQNERSSIAVVASTSMGGISENVHDLAVELPEPGQLHGPVPVPDDGLLGELDVLEGGRVRQVGGRGRCRW